jgi:hypothetical protein
MINPNIQQAQPMPPQQAPMPQDPIPQQAPQQGQMQPQPMQAQQPQGKGVYPAKKEDVDTFASTLMLALHNEKTRANVIKQLKIKNVPVPMKIGTIVAMVISNMLARILQKKRPHLQLILGGINMLVRDVAEMAMMVGVKSTPEERKQAAGIAGGMIEKMLGKQGQAQPMQGQPQGPPKPQGILQNQQPTVGVHG